MILIHKICLKFYAHKITYKKGFAFLTRNILKISENFVSIIQNTCNGELILKSFLRKNFSFLFFSLVELKTTPNNIISILNHNEKIKT